MIHSNRSFQFHTLCKIKLGMWQIEFNDDAFSGCLSILLRIHESLIEEVSIVRRKTDGAERL